MKQPNILSCLVLCVLFSGIAFAEETYQGTLEFALEDLQISSNEYLDVLTFQEGGFTDQVGAPSLPTKQVNIALPRGAEALSVEIIDSKYEMLEGSFNVMPVTQPMHCSAGPQHNPFRFDDSIYGRNQRYPGEQVKLRANWDHYGQAFATLEFFPVQYNPVTGKVYLARQIEFEVKYDYTAQPHETTYNLSEKNRREVMRHLKARAFNPEGVAELEPFKGSATRALDPGDYEYVIITTSTFQSAFQPLADWRTEMGMPAKIVDIVWVYGNYSGTSQEKIREFVIDANATWGTMYFLLGGDTAYIPRHTRTIDGDNIPNDTFYSDHDEDWDCELYVGRACVNSTSQTTTFVNKVLTYEKNPPANYGNKVFFMGFDLDAVTDSEDCKIKIKNLYVPAYASFVSEYDSEGGIHETDVKNYMNQGQNIVNHCDHADTTIVGVGSTNHNDWLNTSEAQNISCGTKCANFYSTGCWAGNYASSCWGEYLTRDDQGGITFVGNSRYGWYSPGNTDSLSHKYDQSWFKVLYLDNIYRIGQLVAYHKNEFNPVGDTYKYIFTELNLLGDPGLHLWTDNPVTLTAAHSGAIYTGPQNFGVNVSYSSTPIEGALVCAMKGTEVYAYGTTNASGNVSLSIDPATAGSMTVTVTAQNYKYYQGTVTVSMGTNPPTIASISPRCGPEAGGDAVTITGTEFTVSPAMTVAIGGEGCTSVTVVNSTTITCNTPAGTNGWRDVVVSNSYGSDSLPGGFRYFPITTDPFNCTNIPTSSLNTPISPTLIVSGNASTMFMTFIAFGPGPVMTKYGEMGLTPPLFFLFTGGIGPAGYTYIPLSLPSGYGPLDFYLQVLGYNGSGKPAWAYGGYNPHSSGESIWFHLNN